MKSTKNKKEESHTSITIEEPFMFNGVDTCNMLGSYEDEDNFLSDIAASEAIKSDYVSSPDSSQDGPAATPPQLYNTFMTITAPQVQQQQLNYPLPMGTFNMNGTMFAPPVLAPQPHLTDPFQITSQLQELGSYFPSEPIIKRQSNEEEEKVVKRGRKREKTEVDEDEKRFQELDSRDPNDLTTEEKREKKKLRNRKTAKKSRDSNKEKLAKFDEIKAENDKLHYKVEELEEKCESLKRENTILRNRLQEPMMSSSATSKASKTTLAFAVLFCVGCTFLLNSTTTTHNNLIGVQPSSDIVRVTNVPTITPVKFQKTEPTISSMSAIPVGPAVVSTISQPTTKSLHYSHVSPSDDYSHVESANDYNYEKVQEQRTNKVKTLPAASDDVRRPGGRTLLAHLSKNMTADTCSLDEGVCRVKDGQMQVPELMFDFDGVGMVKKNFYYPNNMQKHFDSSAISQPEVINKNSNKQLIQMTDGSLYEKVKSKQYKYALGSIYTFPSPIEEEDEDQDHRKTLHLFCPIIYPLLPGPNDELNDMNNMDGLDERTLVKIHVPIQVMNKSSSGAQDGKIVRLAEITGDNVVLSEAYFEPAASIKAKTGN
ncbi:X-box-binding protein [Acrasis kona]|uniref:X-box-binding protein n=1 Tax=Acrasis kona TaxID=1008807 RepID=A0AAW2ZP95_9EUKA